jgi:hypothetical protein
MCFAKSNIHMRRSCSCESGSKIYHFSKKKYALAQYEHVENSMHFESFIVNHISDCTYDVDLKCVFQKDVLTLAQTSFKIV